MSSYKKARQLQSQIEDLIDLSHGDPKSLASVDRYIAQVQLEATLAVAEELQGVARELADR